MSITHHPENIQDMYAWQTTVATYDVGPDRLLTPSAQLRLQQEAGERHFREGGLDFEGIAALGMAFVVLQNNAVIYRRPRMGEDITLKTWSRTIKGVRFYRCYRFEDSEGKVLIDSMATFALVDLHTHAMLRPTAFPYEIKEQTFEHTCADAPRLRMPAEKTPCGVHTVRASELDFNGHLNNTRYADIVFDHLPQTVCEHLQGFSIVFQHEAKHGETVDLFTAEDEQGLYIQAVNGDTPCFTALVKVESYCT